jgi:DNA topoisomerase-1
LRAAHQKVNVVSLCPLLFQRNKLRAAGQTIPDSDEEKEEDETYGVKEKSHSKPSNLHSALARINDRITNYKGQLDVKDQTKDVALGTSKINYMDPRITVAWCKAKEVPLEAIFNKALVAKFPWAMEVKPDWRF